MTLLGILIALALIVGGGCVAYWLIKKFLPPDWHMPALAIVGILLLACLLLLFFPGALHQRIWG